MTAGINTKGIDETARWFAGKGRTVGSVRPRRGAGGLNFLDVAYADGGSETYLDVADELAWGPLLASLRAGPLDGGGGRLELREGPALEPLDGALGGRQRVPATDLSNTVVALGDALLVKAYRRPVAGPHVEIEVLGALAGTGAPVPAFAGSLHWVDGRRDSALALLQAFVPGAEASWEGPIQRAAAVIAGSAPFEGAEWSTLGRSTAELHRALVDAFGLHAGSEELLAGHRAAAEAALAGAASRDPRFAALVPAARARLAALDDAAPPALTRIHGDLHVGQVLRIDLATPPLVIDFEGDPTRPLADRRRPDSPLYDLACLLRCVDHVGSAAARRAAGASPVNWIAAARAAVLEGYAPTAPVPVDAELVGLLELAKECAELVYAQRVAPEWAYAPMASFTRMLADSG
jgi:predicted trehalose synthase